MSKLRDQAILDLLVPDPEEMTFRVLNGECPHDRDWLYVAKLRGMTLYKCHRCGNFEYIQDNHLLDN